MKNNMLVILIVLFIVIPLNHVVLANNNMLIIHITSTTAKSQVNNNCGFAINEACANLKTALSSYENHIHNNNNNKTYDTVTFQYHPGTYYPIGNYSNILLSQQHTSNIIIEGTTNSDTIIDLQKRKSCFIIIDGIQNIILRNLHIKNGAGIDSSTHPIISQKFNSKGGSLILIGGTTAILENMIFTNSTLSGFGFGIQGGVFYIENSSPTFNKCQFIGARAGQGGTGWIQGGSPIFNDCLFDNSETNSKNQ